MKSIDPEIWGPSGWKLVHALAARTAVEPEIAEVFPKLYLLLPCPACQHNYKKHFDELAFPKDPKKVLKWSYDLHQRVNMWKGKNVTLSFKDVEKHWKHAELQWNDIWVFLEAVAEAHLGATRVRKEYVDELYKLFQVLRKVVPLRPIKSEEVVYKVKLRALLKEIKQKNTITAKHAAFTCSSAVCHM